MGSAPEVMAEAVKVLQALEVPGQLSFSFEEAEIGARCYQRTGEDLPRESLEIGEAADAILFGSAGLPDVRLPDGTEIAPQLTLRIRLDLYLGLRPIRLSAGISSALRLAEGARIDYVILRENTEGLYASRGAGVRVGTPGGHRHARRHPSGDGPHLPPRLQLARRRGGAPADGQRRVTCVDKANVLESYAFFREVFDEVAADYPEDPRRARL